MYERFAKLLEEKGLTAYAVSRDCGIPYSTFSDWKSGRIQSPKADKLIKIAKYLGVSVGFLTGATNEPAPDSTGYYVDPESLQLAQEILSNPDYRVLFDASQKLSPDDIRFVIKMIERLSK